jgi:hypothetical protein
MLLLYPGELYRLLGASRFFFQSGSVIVFSIPEIILLSFTKQNIPDFNFGIIKQLLPSYEVNNEQSNLERLFWKTPPFPPLTLK